MLFLKKFLWKLMALNVLPDAVLQVSDSGDIICYNKKAAQILGLDESETAINFSAVFENGFEHVKESAKTQKPVAVNTLSNDVKFYYEINVSENSLGYIVTLRDLTALTGELLNDDKVKRFNGEKNAMLSLLENDIKSPLTSISGFSKGLLDGLGGALTEKQEKYVRIIDSNAEGLTYFMDKLLEFSKAESSLYESDYRIVDITEIIKSVSKEFNTVIENKKLSFDVDYTNLQKFNIYTDVNSIKTAYKNILETSLSMTDNGELSVRIFHPDEVMRNRYHITADKDTSYVAVVIKDSGCGVNVEDIKHLCDPYSQLGKDSKNLLRAFALGTASILVKRAGGFIDINSEVREGSEYIIILPTEKA